MLSNLRKNQLLAAPYTQLLAQYEVAVGLLYHAFARVFPAARAFWVALADEEREHERMIMELEAAFSKGDLVFRRPDTTVARVRDALGFLSQQRFQALRGGISMADALQTAREVEATMLERRFFDIMETDQPAARNILVALEAATRAHAKCITREASRLRWRLTSWRKARPASTSEPFTPTSAAAVNERLLISLAQGTILGLIIALEEAASRLYATYAEALPAEATFWTRLAAEERQHAALLESLETLLQTGVLFHNIGRFRPEELQKEIDFAVQAQTLAASSGVTSHEAQMTALQIERSMTESSFYKNVESDSAEFKEVAQRLGHMTAGHIARLQERIRTERQPG